MGLICGCLLRLIFGCVVGLIEGYMVGLICGCFCEAYSWVCTAMFFRSLMDT